MNNIKENEINKKESVWNWLSITNFALVLILLLLTGYLLYATYGLKPGAFANIER